MMVGWTIEALYIGLTHLKVGLDPPQDLINMNTGHSGPTPN
jgi:hypothetical protein